MIYSADDDIGPSERLVSLAQAAIEQARVRRLDHLDARDPDSLGLADLWPGEHYRLLAGLVAALDARAVVEIGSGSGLSALSMLSAMPTDGRLVTFDLVPWQHYGGTVLRQDDFADGRLEQLTDDLSGERVAAGHMELLAGADLVFVDAAKDGDQEWRFLQLFDTVSFERSPVIAFDDIRLWNMLGVWRGVSRPKLDLTSFGHWSGTGLVDYG
jgi:predicted O-methyltransferase YrrM